MRYIFFSLFSYFVFPTSLMRYQNILSKFRKHQVFGNVPRRSPILYVNFLRDKRPHACLLWKRQHNPSSVKFHNSIKLKGNFDFLILLSGRQKLQFAVCIVYWPLNKETFSSCPTVAVIRG